MPRFLRNFWPFLALSCLAVLTAEPLTRAQMMCSDDAPFHLFRAVELGSLLELGHWFPRWAPHMAQGYGYPFFNFYAPLSSYGVVGLHWAGLAYPAALRLGFILALWLAGVSAFLFVRELFGERAGLAAGAAYLFAPYLAFDVLYRGNLAETAAFIWPPLVLWGIQRGLRAQGTRLRGHGTRPKAPRQRSPQEKSIARSGRLSPEGGVVLPSPFVAVAYAALILTHNIFALIASPLLFGYAALLAWQAREGRGRVLAWAVVSLLAGVALSAYFWLPALTERGLVHSDRLLVPPIFTWYTNFSTTRELLAPLRPFDPQLINPSPARSIGLLTVLAGLPALVSAVANRRRARPGFAPTVSFFAFALAGYCLLNLEVSAPLWRLIQPLELVQFPWRMLGPAALCAAVLVGASVVALEDWLGARARGAWLAAPTLLAVGVVLAGSLPAWKAIYCPGPTTATVADLVAYEDATHTIGTTAKAEYLPRSVTAVPAEPDLAQALRAGVEPSRLRVPEGSQARVLSEVTRDPLDAAFEIEAPTEVTALYRQFYYPGWRVTIDGQPSALAITLGSGLISFQVPPGTHTVRVTFGATPLRAVAAAVSVGTLGILILVVLRMIPEGRPYKGKLFELLSHAKPPHPPAPSPGPFGKSNGAGHAAQEGESQFALPTPLPAIAVCLVVCALVPVVQLGVLNGLDRPARTPAAQYPLLTDVAGGVRLYGYDVTTTRLAADDALDVAWYAAVREPTLRRFWPAVAVEDEAGLTWSVLNPLPPRWHREPRQTPEWGPDQYAQWARHVNLLPGTPPGDYPLYGWVFDRDSLEIASVLDEAGNAVAPRLLLETLTVTRPRRPFSLAPPHATLHAFGPLTLLGYDLDRTSAAAGEALALALYWRSEQPAGADLLARVALLDASGQAAFSSDVEPANGYPTRLWQPADEWLGQARLRLPAALPAGDYSLVVSVPGTGEAQQTLTTLSVSAPERRFEPLPFDSASGAVFGEVAVLEGYSTAPSAEALTVTLAWRATGSPPVSYSVFVHLSDSAGRVWAQSDAVPAGWTRPTTGWVAGEYVRDEHRLPLPPDLPAGDYTLWVGLYDPLSGARVPASGPGAAADQRAAVGIVTLP